METKDWSALLEPVKEPVKTKLTGSVTSTDPPCWKKPYPTVVDGILRAFLRAVETAVRRASRGAPRARLESRW